MATSRAKKLEPSDGGGRPKKAVEPSQATEAVSIDLVQHLTAQVQTLLAEVTALKAELDGARSTVTPTEAPNSERIELPAESTAFSETDQTSSKLESELANLAEEALTAPVDVLVWEDETPEEMMDSRPPIPSEAGVGDENCFMSADEIGDLLAENSNPQPASRPMPEPELAPTAVPPDKGGFLGHDEIQALLKEMTASEPEPVASPPPTTAPADNGGFLGHDEIQALLKEMTAPEPEPVASPPPTTAPADNGGFLGHDEIQALLKEMTAPEPEPIAATVDNDGPMGHEEIQALLQGMSSPPAEPTVTAPTQAAQNDVEALLNSLDSAATNEHQGLLTPEQISALLEAPDGQNQPPETGWELGWDEESFRAECARAMANPEPIDWVKFHAMDPDEVDTSPMDDVDESEMLQALAEKHPDLVAAVEAYNLEHGLVAVPEPEPPPEPFAEPTDSKETETVSISFTAFTAEEPEPDEPSGAALKFNSFDYLLDAQNDETCEETPAESPAVIDEPVIATLNSSPTAEALSSLPPGLAIENLILPLRIEGGAIVCLVAEPIDQAVISQVQKDTGKTIHALATPIGTVVKGIRLAYSELSAEQARDALLTPRPSPRPSPFAFLSALRKTKA